MVVAAHPDDEVLGCGGTVGRLAGQGHEVGVVICAHKRDASGALLEDDEDARYRLMSIQASEALGSRVLRFLDFPDEQFPMHQWALMKEIESVARSFQPHAILAHTDKDYNQDHRIVHDICQVAFRPHLGYHALLFFEVPGSTRPDFAPAFYQILTADDMARTARAWNCYGPEHRAAPHPRSDRGIDSLARWRGASLGADFAETFELGYLVRRPGVFDG